MRSIALIALAGAALAVQARDQLTFANPFAQANSQLVSGSASAASSALMGAQRWAAEGVRQFKQEFHPDGGMHCESPAAGRADWRAWAGGPRSGEAGWASPASVGQGRAGPVSREISGGG